MTNATKTQWFNFFRGIFKVPLFEKWLAKATAGKEATHFLSKWVPSAYLYPVGSFRTLKRNGIVMKVDISDYVGHYLFFGFKDETLERLFALVKPNAYVIDVGSNIGWTTLNLAKLSGGGKVIGFEPDSFNFNVCRQNVDLNQPDNVILLQKGLGSSSGSLSMELRSAFNRGENRISTKGEEISQVIIERLDEVKEIGHWPCIDLIKIDVEGYELHVLKGAERILRKFKPKLFVEVDDDNLKEQGHSAAMIISFLENLDYRDIRHAVSDQPVLNSIDFTHCHFDIVAQ